MVITDNLQQLKGFSSLRNSHPPNELNPTASKNNKPIFDIVKKEKKR